jgi:phosphoribosylformylglycinamidine synthase
MAKARALVLRAAGTNCDYETQYAFQKVGAEAPLVHVNRLLEDPQMLRDFHILCIPGGFTYGDDIAAGKILANQLIHNLSEEVQEFVAREKLILGICNGFQVLVKMGVLPGFSGMGSQDATLTFNDSNRFEDRWVYLSCASGRSVFIEEGDVIYLPVAHAEGKFVPEDDAILERLREEKQIVFQYVDDKGKLAGYPHNPNGSVANIAGICDSTGRILGMMPHPERYVEPYTHPRWTREGLKEEGDGLRIFRNAVNYFS